MNQSAFDHMFESEPDLNMHIQNVGFPPPVIGAQKLSTLDVFRQVRNLA